MTVVSPFSRVLFYLEADTTPISHVYPMFTSEDRPAINSEVPQVGVVDA